MPITITLSFDSLNDPVLRNALAKLLEQTTTGEVEVVRDGKKVFPPELREKKVFPPELRDGKKVFPPEPIKDFTEKTKPDKRGPGRPRKVVEEPVAAPEEALTLEQVRTLVKEAVDAVGVEPVKAVFTTFSMARVSELPASRYPEFAAALAKVQQVPS